MQRTYTGKNNNPEPIRSTHVLQFMGKGGILEKGRGDFIGANRKDCIIWGEDNNGQVSQENKNKKERETNVWENGR